MHFQLLVTSKDGVCCRNSEDRTHGDYQILLLFHIPDVVFIFNLLLLVKMPYLQIKSKGLILKKWKKNKILAKNIMIYEVSSMKSHGMESKKTIAIEQQCYSID